MSTTIAIANQKGGVGKTCTTLNLGIGLALKGKEVLLIDLDPQANLTMRLGWTNPDEQATTISTLLHKTANEQAIEPGEGILRHPEGVDLIPSSVQLSGYEANLLGEFGRESVLRQYIDGVRPLYDYILIDCMPSLNILTINALVAADSVLIPTQPQFFSTAGLQMLFQTIHRVQRKLNPELRIEGVLVTMMDEQQATDVVTVTPDKIDALRRIFSEMNAVEYATETQTTQTEVEINGKTQVIEHINLTLHIYLTSLSYLQAADLYWFTAEERAMLHDLMRPEFVTLFANLLGTNPYGGTAPSVILNNLPANAKGSAIVQAALTKVGCKYVWGSRGPDTFDCSGFVYWCLKQAGISSADALRTSAAGQAQYCVERGWTISRDQLQPGDLIFWQNAACTKGDRWNEIHHTGIYIGDGKVIEASSSKGCVVIRNIWSSQSYPIAYLARIP